ncbi:MAG TPA: glycine--tRNA ligase subunit beta [Persephonella sp.]|nr:glycine--tRNA ligase subunit beta [Hydrogenothermaceae bacterium]HIQ25328.1 glycine--tRNA ligase subunit beta [Persephonella sp.]
MAQYLLEIGTEELPPKAVNIAKGYLKEKVKETFKNFFEYISDENIKEFATPRRLAVLVKNLKLQQDAQKRVIIGPPAKIAIDENGNFLKPALAFASKNNIPIESLQVIENEKGKYIGAEIIEEGKKLEEVIKEEIPKLILRIPFTKTMRWTSSDIRFSRPIRWIVSLLDDKVIEFELANLKVDRYTYLHRFMTNPIGRGERKEIPNASMYEEITKLGFIIANYSDRKTAIETQLTGFASQIGANAIIDTDLLDEVTNLTEFPVGILGDFSPEYLILPREVIITVCKVHQRYFNFEKNGKLIPKFLAISNIAVKDKDKVKQGYEKVLKARLEDALFFYKEDLKHNLEEFYPKLEGIQFHQKLGSMLEKVERNENIADLISDKLGFTNKQDLKRANKLSKCDLLTEMVKEFDELQGIMGMHYALKQGEKEEVAKAIYEHYLPQSTDNDLPQTNIGTILALADKLDTVISFLSIGEKPKGASDPYGIRRATIGIIKILIEKEIDLDLDEVLDEISKKARKTKILKFAQLETNWQPIFEEEIIPQIRQFIFSRISSFLKEQSIDTDVINAVLDTSELNPYRIYLKAKALQKLKINPEFNEIMTVFKRVGRIIPEDFKANLDESLIKENAEVDLYNAYKNIKKEYENLITEKEYANALSKLLEIKSKIDNFFDNVMVMVDDEKLKQNRLSLLKLIDNLFKKIANFEKITTV